MPAAPLAAYLGAQAGLPGLPPVVVGGHEAADDSRGGLDARSAKRGPWAGVAASAMRTSTERRGPRSSAHSKKSSPPAQGSTASDRVLQQLYIINTSQACSLPLKAVSHPKAVQRARHMPGWTVCICSTEKRTQHSRSGRQIRLYPCGSMTCSTLRHSGDMVQMHRECRRAPWILLHVFWVS